MLYRQATVHVKHPDFAGGIRINEQDFDPAVHVLFEDEATPDAGATATWCMTQLNWQ